LRGEIQELEKLTAEADFWSNREKAGGTLATLKDLKRRLDPWTALRQRYQDLAELYTLALDEGDRSVEPEIVKGLDELEAAYGRIRILEYLSDENDEASTFLTIHAGAGGTEACDWAGMLLRMYTRWAERQGYEVELADALEAEAGFKSVTVLVKGDYAHGYLKGESGVHRLVRISPFDANKRRHTTFASVYCSPELDDDAAIEIKPEDLRVDTFRAGGAGGQHVNKTESAVRMTHLPTGIVVQCQNERSQHKNRSMALKMLRSRLYEYFRLQKDKERDRIESEKKDISWGNQIRSYVFQPYTLVKDHRTKHEIGNVQGVMDGDIEPFIEEYLKLAWTLKQKQN
jgi:peptide chain release factor 2